MPKPTYYGSEYFQPGWLIERRGDKFWKQYPDGRRVPFDCRPSWADQFVRLKDWHVVHKSIQQ